MCWLESGAVKTEDILKTPQQKGFYFFVAKNLILTRKKHCGESRRCRNVSAGAGHVNSIYFTTVIRIL